jgi:hypothetical protein
MKPKIPPLSVRWSSNEEDARDASREAAVQVRPQRSILKALEVRPVPPSVVKEMIEGEHYLRSMPGGVRLCFGVYLDSDLVGAVVFTSGARQGHRLLGAARPQDVVTLSRLWLSDALPKNSESRILGVVLRELRRGAPWKLILSYADPAAGHVGTIYKASGWLYLGQTEPNTYIDLGDGRLHHPRSIYNRFGSNAVGHLRATGVAAIRERVGGKHRYAYVLDPAWRWRLRGAVRPYPRARGVGRGAR